MKTRKVPMRSCVGCSESKPKKELVRIVRSPEGELSIDLVGKKPGRGAYICPNPECLKKAKKGKRLEKSLETAVGEEVYEALARELERLGEQNG